MAEPVGKVNIKQPVDPERVHIHKDPFHPAAFVVSLPLDSEPSYVWLTFFDQVLWSSLDFWDRKVIITGKELKLATDPTGMGEKLHWVEGLVSATNKKVDEYNKTQGAMKKAETTKMLDEDAVRKDIQTWTSGRIIP
jgi:hypothetical protein